jgi:hypothetical protein
MNRADKFRDESEDAGSGAEGGFERAFGAARGSGDEIDFEAGFLAESEDGGDGVFLGTADDQTRDDVRDPHPGWRIRATV